MRKDNPVTNHLTMEKELKRGLASFELTYHKRRVQVYVTMAVANHSYFGNRIRRLHENL